MSRHLRRPRLFGLARNFISNRRVGFASLANRWVGFAFLATSACAGQEPPDGPSVAISVAPLNLEGIDNATYTVTVANAQGETVWSRELTSNQYGNGRGDITYVGPCDASESANPNTVTVTLDSLVDTTGRTLVGDDWKQPPPMVKSVVCAPNADVQVAFELTVLRAARQGFFDVVVDLDDVFCSAKMDCQDKLLHRPGPDGERDLTAVVAFACTAGQLAPGVPDETYLYWGDAAIVCRDNGVVTQRFPVPTHRPEGNNGPIASTVGAAVNGVFQSATYRGKEGFDDYDKCYWNFALGLDLANLGPNCTFEAVATASSGRFDPDLQTPPDAVYPIIRWDVPLTRSGALVCGPNPLNGQGSMVTTEYTDFASLPLQTGTSCGGEPFARGVECDGLADTEPGVSFIPQPDGQVLVTHNGQTYGPFALPAGTTLGAAAECCVDPCCEESP